MHREIDRFTDQHPQVKESIALFRPTQRKYSPVVVDILYDYFLTKFWHNYHPQNLPEFISETYATLSRFQSIFPEKLQLLFPRMIEDDFLMSCKNQERLTRTFERLGNRASFAHQFHRAIDDLQFFEEDVTTHFTLFFPELKLHIHRLYFTSN
jgi:acyl carrier protein phosphodiesterase